MVGKVPRRTRVKVCGTTRLEDALVAADCGADALGFIFYSKSPRAIAPEKAAQIIKQLPPFVDRVGVFVNATIDEVVAVAATGLSALQLHGNESVDYCWALRQKLPCCSLIKAIRVGAESRPDDFAAYHACVDAFLLDTYVQGERGGTGRIFDWSIIEQLQLHGPILLAGGLSPENVLAAISAVHPYAVDINSGVESHPGVKDHARLKNLLQLVYQTALW
ncbi:phosphoribosylanthranilate isomerase [Desulfocastanea catecholica]